VRVVSVNSGEKRTLVFNNRSVETGIFKTRVDGPIYLGSEHVKGDTIVDRKHHGGIDQAVYGYSKKHYLFWQKKYDFVGLNYGLFGENITFDDLDETKIHVGSIFRCEDVLIEATSPRFPCFKLGIVFKTQNIVKEFWEITKSGVYFKVLSSGEVRAGSEFVKVEEALKQPTISQVYEQCRPSKLK